MLGTTYLVKDLDTAMMLDAGPLAGSRFVTRAGEIIEARCLAENRPAGECRELAETARQDFVDATFNGGAATISG